MINATRKPWTTWEEALLRELYPDTPMPVLLQVFNRSLTAIQSRAGHLGLKRSQAFHDSGRSGRLQPGDARGAATQFKRRAVSA